MIAQQGRQGQQRMAIRLLKRNRDRLFTMLMHKFPRVQYFIPLRVQKQ
jgi:hypothetical protein